MNISELMVVDEISNILLTEDEEYNIASLSNSMFKVLIPKNIEIGDKIIHIRPGVVITNPNVKISKEYWSDELQAYLSPIRRFFNRRIGGIAISMDDLNYNDDFKNLLKVKNSVFPENSSDDPLDYFDNYGICNLEDYLYMRSHSLMNYKPNKIKFFNLFKVNDKKLKSMTNNSHLELFGKNSLSIEESDLDKYNLIINEELNGLYSGFVYIVEKDEIFFTCKERRISFIYSKINKVIKKYEKLIKKAKKKNSNTVYTDEIILELIKISKIMLPNLRNKLKDDYSVLVVGCQTIGKKVLDNSYNIDSDFYFFVDNLMLMGTKPLRVLNPDTYVEDGENFSPLKPIKIITNEEKIKFITNKINEEDLKYFESNFLNKYLKEDDSGILHNILNKNPEAIALNYYYLGDEFDWICLTLDNSKYKKYLKI